MAKFLKEKEEKVNVDKTGVVYDKDLKVFYANGSKYRRAKDILTLVRGERAPHPNKPEELERKEHYSRQMAIRGIDTKSDEALAMVYELIGGLIRNPQEQKQAEEISKREKAKGKKKMVE